jgi:hypothetical protein
MPRLLPDAFMMGNAGLSEIIAGRTPASCLIPWGPTAAALFGAAMSRTQLQV